MVSEQRMDAPKKHTQFYWLFAIILGMVAVRNVFHIAFPIVVFLVMAAAIAMFCEKDEIIAFSVACIPLSTAFQYKYVLFICIIVYCIRFSSKVKITPKVIPIVLMIFWEMLHIGMGEFNWVELLRCFAELIFLAFLFSVEEEKFNFKLICRTFAITTIVICFCILLIQLESNSYDFSKLFSGTLRFGAADLEIENFGLNFNENGLGGICNLAIIGTLIIVDEHKLKTIDIIIISLLAVFGTMTMSQTFLICFAIIILYYFAFQSGSVDKKIIRALGIIVIGVLSFILLRVIMPQVIENFTARFTEDDISNGRIELFKFYNEHLLSSPKYLWFGIGLQNPFDKIKAIYSMHINVCHSGFQEILIVWGIPGLCMCISLLYNICSQSVDNRVKRNLLQYGPLAVILIISIVGQFITKGINLLGLSFAYLCLRADLTNNSVQ